MATRKGAMSSSPFGAVKAPRGVQVGDLPPNAAPDEVQDAMRRPRQRAVLDTVTELIGDKVYVTNKGWPWMVRQDLSGAPAMRVSRFYLGKNLAVDMFVTQDYDRAEVAQKRALCKANGVKYVALFPETTLEEAEVELTR